MTDIYERLARDHRAQRELLARVAETQGDSEQRRSLFAELSSEVSAHAAAEEQTFYAELIAKPKGQEKARHSVSEPKEAADMLEALKDTEMSSGGWLQRLKSLQEALEHHVDEEEEEIFKRARKLIAKERAAELAVDFDAHKSGELKRQ